MIIDDQSTFCWKQAITATGYSSNAGDGGNGYIDLGASDTFSRNSDTGYEYHGAGEPLALVVGVVQADLDDGASPQAATAAVVLETADDASFSSNKTTILAVGTFTAGDAIGTCFVHGLPIAKAYRRYLRVAWTVSNGPFTAGKLSAFIVKSVDINVPYPSRIEIQ